MDVPLLELRPVAVRIAPVKIGPVLTERTSRTPALPRGKRPTRAIPAPTREVPPKARNLPRRAGY
ncbi:MULTISPECIES: hypothetical protein [unclassified Streptomyces]|uniref:hypothetical protein n=1 Tax=unclassified Streptomyces TaxID=2593676 RepID=UPI002E2D4446|nr:hypothetical protein [Streptomyces sp. NBC_00441]